MQNKWPQSKQIANKHQSNQTSNGQPMQITNALLNGLASSNKMDISQSKHQMASRCKQQMLCSMASLHAIKMASQCK